MEGVYDFLFYGMIIVGVLLIGGLTYYRIDRKRAAQQAAIDRVKAKNGGKAKAKKPEKKPTDFLGRLDYELKHRHDKK